MPRFTVLRRLQLIYLFTGMMFFYGIEQLFLNRHTGSDSARGYITIAFAVGLVLFDVPTGILADRLGRKFCMVASAITMIIALIVLGSSSSLLGYLVGTILFSLQMCLFNGATQAFLYDWLTDIKQAKLYARRQGTMYAWWLCGAAIANFASGFIAHKWGLRNAYFASILPSLGALVLIISLKEPAFEKSSENVWYKHAHEAFTILRTHKTILEFTLFSVAATVVLLTICEFGQIYLLHFGISTITLGILWAIDAIFAASGRASAHVFQRRPKTLIGLFCIALAAFEFAGQFMVGIGLFWILYGLNEALANVAESEVQAHTPAHMRATMLSLMNCTSNTIAVPVILFFTAYNTHHGIIAANRMVIVGVVVFLAAVLLWSRRATSDVAVSA
jgi:MFS family permease